MLVLLKRPPTSAVRSARLLRYRPAPRRGFIDFQPLADGFIAVANTLPFPESWPKYSTTIILGTLVVRTAWTLPPVIWARSRRRKQGEVVQPELSKQALILREEVGKATAKKKLPYEEYKREYYKQLVATRKELDKKHGTNPLVTTLVPPAMNMPLFFLISLMLRQAATAPTPLSSESFLTFETLASTDTSGIMPIAFGLITLANFEIMSKGPPAPKSAIPQKPQSGLPRNLLWTNRGPVLEFGLRFLPIVVIVLALNMPGAVVLYWVTSSTYTFIERLLFTTIDRRNAWAAKVKFALAKAAAEASPGDGAESSSSPATRKLTNGSGAVPSSSSSAQQTSKSPRRDGSTKR
ncbi:hypothetical protein CALVIDRAFT_539670 [Calocera viscosa TUFC12733]|uniref:Membrane insertase YidC/Oxa/ALB C-terminal domain-containing protein n=1 Tax=Calocera viscosa (strain TUFC12733) TaxID=1330018 RepID=A0A167JP16_CALVF|nr:hypothetical protein CALVIDRAFT_539670 [Calocera viscosa TUFC12733]